MNSDLVLEKLAPCKFKASIVAFSGCIWEATGYVPDCLSSSVLWTEFEFF